MTVPPPTAEAIRHRPDGVGGATWRCTRRGDLPRFPVVRSAKAVGFVHLRPAGEPGVEKCEVVNETIKSMRCRWCNAVDQVELVDRPGAGS